MANDSPTLRQLAYLDELKMRLDDLRDRQMAFIAQTAKILESMSSSGLLDDSEMDVPTAAVVVAAAAVTPKDTNSVKKQEESPNGSKIKELVQRFEDLRKTSEQFTDLPVPQELIGVDVRKLLTGYEKIIEDGNVLQQSWYLLRKSTENCARRTRKEEFPPSSHIYSSSELHLYSHDQEQNSEKSISNRNASPVAFGKEKAKNKEIMYKNSDDITDWSHSKQKYADF
ncbi:uncharacterized protein [Drosophila tropicalis]|uniref:uncharacterized protein isoform X2 n=1 Tax=Drosophila tropicalis TaxID=46794 RepID=UPI0035AC0C93